MNLSKILFCNQQVDNILDEDTKSNILNQMYNKYQISISDKKYVMLKREFINNLSKNSHLIGIITHGNPYYLYLTTYNGQKMSLLIDRKTKDGFSFPKIILMKYRFDDSLYNDTIFDGELIKTCDNRWLYLITDILVQDRKKITNDIISKYNNIYNILNNLYVQDPFLEICPIQVRKLFPYNKYEELIHHFIPSLRYKCKGLIFYPLNSKYKNVIYLFPRNSQLEYNIESKINKQKHIKDDVKIKPTKKNDKIDKVLSNINEENVDSILINLKLIDTIKPDIYELYSYDGNEEVKQGYAHVPSLRCSKMIKNAIRKLSNDKCIFRCKYSLTAKKWEPVKLSDSTSPDNINNLNI